MGEIADAIIEGILSEDGEYSGGGWHQPHRRRKVKPAASPRPQPVPLTERPTSPYHIAARIEAGIPVTEDELRRLAAHVMGTLSGPKRGALQQKFPKVRPAQEGQGNG